MEMVEDKEALVVQLPETEVVVEELMEEVVEEEVGWEGELGGFVVESVVCEVHLWIYAG